MKKGLLKTLCTAMVFIFIFTIAFPTINYATDIEKDITNEEVENEKMEKKTDESINNEKNTIEEKINVEAEKLNLTDEKELKTDKIEDGTYYISSAIDENKVISINNGEYNDYGNAHIWENEQKEYQKFDVKYNKNVDAYIITAVHSNKSLDVSGAGQSNGTNVIQYRTHNGNSEQWMLKETKSGYYNIISKCNYLNLDVSGGLNTNGTNIQVFENNKTPAQEFKFIKAEKNEGTRTIEDGIYTIGTKLDKNKALQIENGEISNNAKVKFERRLNISTKNQEFEIKYLNNGYYEIKQYKSLKTLEVNNGEQYNRTDIVQNPENVESTIQQWIIKDAGDGYFYIIARCNGLYMDIPNGIVTDNPKIQMFEGNGTDAQKFSFTKVEELKTDKIEDGTYYISSAIDGNKVISINNGEYNDYGNVHIWENEQKEYQKFDVKYNKNVDAYIITAVHSNKSLDVSGAGQSSGTNVIQYRTHDGNSEQWILKETKSGYYNIISKCNYLNLDVSGGLNTNGTNIQVYEENGTIAQEFKFIKAEKNEGTRTIEDGIYTIGTKLDKNKALQIENGEISNNAKVKFERRLNISTKNQEFEIKYLNNGYYEIKQYKSLKTLEVNNGEQYNRTDIVQNPENVESTIQQWIIKDAGDGYFYIIARCNGLYMDIPNGIVTDNPKIQMFEGNGTDAQKFSFTKVEELKTDKIEDGTYYISSAIDENKVISINNGEYNDYGNAHIWENEQKEYQKFDIKYNKNVDAYIITAVHSNKSLDVSGAGQSNETNVIQYRTHDGNSEQWILKETQNGYYNIISKCNYLNLDVSGGLNTNGTNIQTYEENGTLAQEFKFIKAEKNENIQTIENGIYNIITKLDENKALQIENNSLSNNSMVKFENKLNVINKVQSFEITYMNNGYYEIKQHKSLKALEVNNGGQYNGTNIIQNSENVESTIQQWIIKDAGDGYFYIIARCNGLYMDIPNGVVTNNPKIQMFDGNGTDAQKFKFVQAQQELKGEQVIEDGVYKIKSALDNRKCIDVSNGSYENGGNVQIWDNANVQQQKFQLTYNTQKHYYEIKSVNSGKVLDVQGDGKTDCSNVWQYEENNSEAQQWILQNAGDGYYYIVAVNSYLYLDVNRGITDNGTNIQIYEGNEQNSQKFKFEKTKMIDSDSYNIAIKHNENKVLDVDGGLKEDDTNVQIWDFISVNHQIFKIEYIDDTYCKIIARHSDKVLTVKEGNVVQREYYGTEEQLWSFEVAGDGYYKIKSKLTDLYLDIAGNETANGTNVQVYTGNTSNAQKFKFKELSKRYGIDVSVYNGNINWAEVRKSGKVDYAIIRAGYRGFVSGKLMTDGKFERNVKEATKNGIDIGLYFFTQAVNEQEAIEEANYVLNLVRKYNVNVKYPIVIDTEYSTSKTNGILDYEGRADQLDVATRTAVCRAFCETIRNAGYTPAVYASRNWFYDNLDVNQLNNCDIWVAHYTGDVNRPTDYRYRYNMWQYTSSGSVPGVYAPVENGRVNVDMSICYKKY